MQTRLALTSRRREKGEGRGEKGEGRREKGEGRREKGEGEEEWKRIIKQEVFSVATLFLAVSLLLNNLNPFFLF